MKQVKQGNIALLLSILCYMDVTRKHPFWSLWLHHPQKSQKNLSRFVMFSSLMIADFPNLVSSSNTIHRISVNQKAEIPQNPSISLSLSGHIAPNAGSGISPNPILSHL